MLKFFRKIRRQQLRDNKFMKYLLYAIGEIILVVVGILIALQVNNWNNLDQQKKEEKKVLQSLYSALEINKEEYDKNFQAQIERHKSIEKLLFSDLSNFSASDIDSLIGRTTTNFTFNPSLGIYESMISSGKIELLSNSDIKNEISKLGDIIRDYQENEEIVAEFTRKHMYEFFINNYRIQPEILSGLRIRSQTEEKSDREFYLTKLNSDQVKNMYLLLFNEITLVVGEGKELSLNFQNLIESIREEMSLY